DLESLPREESLKTRVLSAHGIAVAWITLDRFGQRASHEPTSPDDPVFHLRRVGGGAGHLWRLFRTRQEAVVYLGEAYGRDSEGALRRKVHYLATAGLFRHPLAARFLRACGAIPVYRKQDDPDKMDKNLGAFAACFKAFGDGRLVAIYPEGATHAEVRVQRIKTGAARIALGYEAERPGELHVVPVGLNFDARKSFRGRVLVSFGSPIPVTPYRDAYRADPI